MVQFLLPIILFATAWLLGEDHAPTSDVSTSRHRGKSDRKQRAFRAPTKRRGRVVQGESHVEKSFDDTQPMADGDGAGDDSDSQPRAPVEGVSQTERVKRTQRVTKEPNNGTKTAREADTDETVAAER